MTAFIASSVGTWGRRIAPFVAPPRGRIRVRHVRQVRAMHGVVIGYGTLCAAALCGGISKRWIWLPKGMRGAPVSFVMAAILRWKVLSIAIAAESVLSLAPAAVALLLIASRGAGNRPSKELAKAFTVGAIGSIIGALCGATGAVTMCNDVTSVVALAAAFCATYVGGTLNFVAVIGATGLAKLNPNAVAAALAADIAFMGVYFCALFAIGARVSKSVQSAASYSETRKWTPAAVVRGMAVSAVAGGVYVMGRLICESLKLRGGSVEMLVPILAGMLRRFAGDVFVKDGEAASDIAVSIFFAALGACVSITELSGGSTYVFVMCGITLVMHALFMVFGWAALKLDIRDCLVASNANIGGPTTAAAFAGAMGWSHLVGGAFCVGVVGYAVATPLALIIIHMLRLGLGF